MKRFATKTLVMTAALAAFAVGASAQSMNAEIPFTFRAGDAVLAAGSYRINVEHTSGNNAVIRLNNDDTKKGIMLMPRYRVDAVKSWAGPKLVFACTGSDCVLTTVWNGSDSSAMVTARPTRRGKEVAEIRVVNMAGVKAE